MLILIFTADRWHSNQNLVQVVHLDPAMTWLLTVVAVLMLRFTSLLLPDHVFHQVNDPFTRAGLEYVLRVNYKHLMLVCLLNGMNKPSTEWTVSILLSLLTHGQLGLCMFGIHNFSLIHSLASSLNFNWYFASNFKHVNYHLQAKLKDLVDQLRWYRTNI